jgi:hypothetical protein
VCEFGKGTVIFVVVFQLFLQILLDARKDARRQFRIWTCCIRPEGIGDPMYIVRLLIEPGFEYSVNVVPRNIRKLISLSHLSPFAFDLQPAIYNVCDSRPISLGNVLKFVHGF